MALVKKTARIFNKATDVGDDKCVVVPPQGRFVAELNLGSWTKVAIGMYLSTTDASGDDVTWSGGREMVGSWRDRGYIILGDKTDNEGIDDVTLSGAGWHTTDDSLEYTSAVYNDGTYFYWQRKNGGANNDSRSAIVAIREGASSWQSNYNRRRRLGESGSVTSSTDFASLTYMTIKRNVGSTDISVNDASNSTGTVTMDALVSDMGSAISVSTYSPTVDITDKTLNFLMVQWPFVDIQLRIHAWRVAVIE